MKISYDHPIRFLATVAAATTALEQLTADPESDQLPVRPGDYLRWLMPRRELAGRQPDQLSLALLPNNAGQTLPLDQRTPVATVGGIRPQACERYTHFRLHLGGFTPDRWSQFELRTQDGSALMDHFGGSFPDQSALMQALKEHMESFAHARVKAHVSGPLLDVFMEHNERFRLYSSLSVALGPVSQTNTNQPGLAVRLLSSGNVQPAFHRYNLSLSGTMVEGNRFSFNDRLYTVQAGDTHQTLLDYFAPGVATPGVATPGGKVDILDSVGFSLYFEPGERRVRNVGLPSVYATREVAGTPDRYRVRVQRFEPGNIISLSTTGKSLSYTVQSTDTVASIEAALNPDGGYFDVPQNDQLHVRTLPGVQQLTNDNRVEFTLINPEAFPESTYYLYGVTVGSDVVKGNIFRLGDQTYVARSGDTNLSVALALAGKSTNYFTVQSQTPLEGWAEVGSLYTEEDRADVSVWQQPFVEESPYVVAELHAPDLEGDFVLCLTEAGQLVSIGPALHLGACPDSCLLEVAGEKHVFDWHYGEPGLTQRLRLPLLMRTGTPEIEETEGKLIDGTPYTMNVRVEYVAPFSTTQLRIATARALVSLLKHERIFVDGQPVRAEAVKLTVLSEYGQLAQVSGSMRRLDLATDNHHRLLFPTAAGAGQSILRTGYLFGLQMLMSNTNFTRQIQEGQNAVPVGGYWLDVSGHAFGGSDGLLVQLRDQDQLLTEFRVERNGRYRSPAFRVRPGQQLFLSVAHTDLSAATAYQPAVLITEDLTAETRALNTASFGEAYHNDFNRS